ncbi:MAG: beta-N-acetylhexosaminidase [Tannerellaceae bacterium]|jgi:hexosaminidase|nr:beta-N-acetylhexosaminidase [Tannerellaceae bacterium]
MNTLSNILFASLALTLSACVTESADRQAYIIPAPAELTYTPGITFNLKATTPIAYSDTSLSGLAGMLAGDLEARTGGRLKVDDAPSAFRAASIFLELSDGKETAGLPRPYGVSPKGGDPSLERYSLTITKDAVRLTAPDSEGLYRAITTLRQIVGANSLPVRLPALQIYDSPHYAWRGLSLDVCRTFFDVGEVKEVIDILSLYKMNVLHLHLTDSEGWRIEIKAYPGLTATGGNMPNKGRRGGFYTQEEYAGLVAYAAERFITVVPEIDMPGHTASMLASYPELKNAVTVAPQAAGAMGVPMVALDPDDAMAMDIVAAVITELSALTPGAYIHTGGDETFGMPGDKYVRFVDKANAIVRGAGKRTVGWQESSRTNIDSTHIIQHWVDFGDIGDMMGEGSSIASALPPETLKAMVAVFSEAPLDVERALRAGAKIILSPAGHAYLDFKYLEQSADTGQEADRARLGMPFYPPSTIEETWNWNPSTYHPMIGEDNIAGIEAAIWCETIESLSDMEFMLLPRLPGVAERAWSLNPATPWPTYLTTLTHHLPLWDASNYNYFHPTPTATGRLK